MNAKLRKSLVAGAIAALISAPGWAAGEADSATGSQAQTTQGASSTLYSMTPQQLRRMEVVDATGEEIGNVRSVVQSSTEQEKIHVVISSGGFLGVGGKEVAVPLDEVTLMGDKLQLGSSKAELEAQPEYQSEQYVELQPADQPISDFAAFESEPGQSGQQQPGQSIEPGSSSPGTSSPGTYREGGAGSESPSSPGTMER